MYSHQVIDYGSRFFIFNFLFHGERIETGISLHVLHCGF